ncbi:hypothetical protein M011DRAFT_512448 [Sporormia fimetaria CBS 119925]|uniref:Uncharacterized protein n=1 Tax=Sporormia fimetaria CBS 119925 TaxID=1340428 RepID=A0A6A6UX24_9PLEO|nr:hypothetical protein M011DRAFT_512448 [Sporormia fimetaria CBS 119925]
MAKSQQNNHAPQRRHERTHERTPIQRRRCSPSLSPEWERRLYNQLTASLQQWDREHAGKFLNEAVDVFSDVFSCLVATAPAVESEYSYADQQYSYDTAPKMPVQQRRQDVVHTPADERVPAGQTSADEQDFLNTQSFMHDFAFEDFNDPLFFSEFFQPTTEVAVDLDASLELDTQPEQHQVIVLDSGNAAETLKPQHHAQPAVTWDSVEGHQYLNQPEANDAQVELAELPAELFATNSILEQAEPGPDDVVPLESFFEDFRPEWSLDWQPMGKSTCGVHDSIPSNIFIFAELFGPDPDAYQGSGLVQPDFDLTMIYNGNQVAPEPTAETTTNVHDTNAIIPQDHQGLRHPTPTFSTDSANSPVRVVAEDPTASDHVNTQTRTGAEHDAGPVPTEPLQNTSHTPMDAPSNVPPTQTAVDCIYTNSDATPLDSQEDTALHISKNYHEWQALMSIWELAGYSHSLNEEHYQAQKPECHMVPQEGNVPSMDFPLNQTYNPQQTSQQDMSLSPTGQSLNFHDVPNYDPTLSVDAEYDGEGLQPPGYNVHFGQSSVENHPQNAVDFVSWYTSTPQGNSSATGFQGPDPLGVSAFHTGPPTYTQSFVPGLDYGADDTAASAHMPQISTSLQYALSGDAPGEETTDPYVPSYWRHNAAQSQNNTTRKRATKSGAQKETTKRAKKETPKSTNKVTEKPEKGKKADSEDQKPNRKRKRVDGRSYEPRKLDEKGPKEPSSKQAKTSAAPAATAPQAPTPSAAPTAPGVVSGDNTNRSADKVQRGRGPPKYTWPISRIRRYRERRWNIPRWATDPAFHHKLLSHVGAPANTDFSNLGNIEITMAEYALFFPNCTAQNEMLRRLKLGDKQGHDLVNAINKARGLGKEVGVTNDCMKHRLNNSTDLYKAWEDGNIEGKGPYQPGTKAHDYFTPARWLEVGACFVSTDSYGLEDPLLIDIAEGLDESQFPQGENVGLITAAIRFVIRWGLTDVRLSQIHVLLQDERWDATIAPMADDADDKFFEKLEEDEKKDQSKK